jgi:two-component system NtrC family sensor kinase
MPSRISFKLIVVVGCVTVLIVGLFSYIVLNAQHAALLAQVQHYADQLSETIKAVTKYDMLLNHREGVHRTIDTVGEQPGMRAVRIFNKEGAIIFSSDKRETAGSMVDKRAEACFGCHAIDKPLERLAIPQRTRIFQGEDGARNLGIINPIYNQPDCWQSSCHAHEADQKVLGILDVTMSLEYVDRQVYLNKVKLIVFALGSVLAISCILWVFVQRMVGRPVSELVKATNVVAAGDLNYKIKLRTRDELGNLAASFNEMTQRLAEVQQQLYQSEKLASLGRLAAGVAHEINNPLTGVMTFSSFLLKRAGDDEALRSDLEVILRETTRCREIVKGLLDFARPAPAKKTRISVNEVLGRTEAVVQNQLTIKNITLKSNLDPALPDVMADRGQLEQVFLNLLVNAIDAVEERGVITVSTRSLRENGTPYVAVSVRDTGIGIAPEQLSKVFEPFYTTKGSKGTGLGLAVVWAIVEKHNGTINIESEPGKGTVVNLRFPA